LLKQIQLHAETNHKTFDDQIRNTFIVACLPASLLAVVIEKRKEKLINEGNFPHKQHTEIHLFKCLALVRKKERNEFIVTLRNLFMNTTTTK